MSAYYNEFDPFAAEWLRLLIAAGHIAPGDVDTRSIKDVRPDDLNGYTQCHFFAGIGGWSLALRIAGWPDERPVWTGSCPCQPFSIAGRGSGTADERHLWPHWFHLIGERRPVTIFGEQVAQAIKHGWLDLVSTDLEGIGYAVGAVDICAAGVGAPHIRQRLTFVARALGDAGREGLQERVGLGRVQREALGAHAGQAAVGAGDVGRMADDDDAGCGLKRREELLDGERPAQRHDVDGRSADGALADADGRNASTEGLQRRRQHGQLPQDGGTGYVDVARDVRRGFCGCCGASIPNRFGEGRCLKCAHFGEFWRRVEWLPCSDGKWRPVEPGTFPLAHGVPARVGRLRGYGNAIVPQAAAEVIKAALDAGVDLI